MATAVGGVGWGLLPINFFVGMGKCSTEKLLGKKLHLSGWVFYLFVFHKSMLKFELCTRSLKVPGILRIGVASLLGKVKK